GDKAVHAAVFLRRFVVDLGGQRQHADHGQLVTLADLVVVLVVGRRDLHYAGAELAVHVFISNDGNLATHQWQGYGLADQVLVAFIFRVHHHGHVAQHGFGAGGGHDQLTFTAAQWV